MKEILPHKVPEIYSESLSTLNKALYVLSAGKEFLPIRRIADAIKLLEGREHDKDYDSKLNRNLYSALSSRAKKDVLIQRLRLGGEYMYGLKQWHQKGSIQANQLPR